jgi:hypothetical protein
LLSLRRVLPPDCDESATVPELARGRIATHMMLAL